MQAGRRSALRLVDAAFGGDAAGPGKLAGGTFHLDRRVQLIFDTALDGLLVVDDGRRYLRVNEPAAALLGAPVQAILGARIDDFTPPEHHDALRALWAKLQHDGRLGGHYDVLRGDGLRSWITFRARWQIAPGEHLIAARELMRSSYRTWTAAAEEQLTVREREVLRLVAEGQTSDQIAKTLVVSPTTVKTHLVHIYAKLGVADRASAVATGLRRGLIT